MYDKFLLPWDFTSVATVINNYAAIRIKHKWHTDAILNEADFIQVTMCLAYKPACWQLSCISFCVRSKYSTLLGRTAATCVWVIWLYYQNMNIIMYTHFSDSIPMRATAAMSSLLWGSDRHGEDWFHIGVLSSSSAANCSFSGLNYIKENLDPTFLKHLLCIVIIPLISSTHMLCTKTDIGFKEFRNLITWVDYNFNRANSDTQRWITQL